MKTFIIFISIINFIACVGLLIFAIKVRNQHKNSFDEILERHIDR